MVDNMKNIFSFIIFLTVVLITQVSFAEVKLTQPVIDLIKSNKFAIRFAVTSELDNSTQIDQNAMKYAKVHDMKTVNTLVFDGNNALTITEGFGSYPELEMYGVPGKQHASFATLYSNGESYLITEKGKGILYNAAFEPNVKNIQQITHYVGANNKQGTMAFDSAYRQFVYYLLPLLPEMNSTTDLQGNEVKLNNCTVFSKIGEVNYGGKNYQFEEYKTPDGFPIPMVTLYYFREGKLVKIIQTAKRTELDAGEDWEIAFGNKKVNTGSLAIVEVLEITDNFNSACFQVPQGVKVMDFESPF